MLGIIERFLRLIQVDVFRQSARRGDDQISLAGDRDFVQAVKKNATDPMRQPVIAGNRLDNPLFLVEHNIEDEVAAANIDRFFQIEPQPVAFDSTCPRTRFDHPAVVGLDGFAIGYTRHQRFGPAAVAGKIMVLDVADANPVIRLCDD